MYAKVIKYISWALLIISVVIAVWGFVTGFETNDAVAVDTLLYWAYAMVAVGIASIVLFGIGITAVNDPKSLIKLGVGVLALLVIIAIAYFLAPGTPAVGLVGDQPADSTLKLTDTILNVTYFAFGCAIISILIGVVVNAVRSK